jgi:hypothetical protein
MVGINELLSASITVNGWVIEVDVGDADIGDENGVLRNGAVLV